MSRDLRKLLDAIDEQEQDQSELEKMVEFLKAEVDRLNFTVGEQRRLIQRQETKMEGGTKLPYEVEILKDMVVSQRKELTKKDKDIEILNDLIHDLKESGTTRNNFEEPAADEELLKAKRNIVLLTEQNEKLKEERQKAKEVIGQMTREKQEYQKEIQQLEHDLEHQEKSLETEVNHKEVELEERLNIASGMSEKLQLEVEQLQAEVIELNQELERERSQKKRLEAQAPAPQLNCDNCEELELANQKIKSLFVEIEDFQGQIEFLKEELERAKEEPVAVIMDDPEMEAVIDVETEKLLEENQRLARDLKTSKMTIDNLITDIQTHLSEKSEQEQTIRDQNVKISALERKIEIYKDQNVQLQERLHQHVESSAETEVLDESLSETIEDLQKQNKELKLRISALQLEIATKSEKQHSAIGQATQEAVERVRTLELQLQDLSQQYEEAKEQIERDQNIKHQSADIIQSLRKQVEHLNAKVVELESSPQAMPQENAVVLKAPSLLLSRSYQEDLTHAMFESLDGENKHAIKARLIKALKSPNREVKKYAINTLSNLPGKDVLDEIINMANDADWIIKLYVIKALTKFNGEIKVKQCLESLLDDDDVDVRELALKSLKKYDEKEAEDKKEHFRQDLSLNRWNWSEKEGKWIYIEIDQKGNKKISSQLEPPQEFIELSMELKTLNDQMMNTSDINHKDLLFEKMKALTRKMQEMAK